ncbi:MAG: hypothetical protein IKR16_06280 [Firmicutes bacterium]|nr:hypothetical protein [Bacillota bacterium]
MKRTIALLLAVVLIMATLICSVSASELSKDELTSEEVELYTSLSAALSSDMEVCETEYGVSPEELDSSMLGYPIHTYEYTSDGQLKEMAMLIIPVFCGEKEVYEIAVSDMWQEGENIISCSKALSDRLNLFLGKEIAIIYDINGMTIVDSSMNFMEFRSGAMVIPNRGDIPKDSISEIAKNVEFARVTGRVKTSGLKKIGSTEDPRSLPFVLLYPPHVAQVYSNICWAACVACIGEYRTGVSNSAYYVAKHLYGPYLYNQGATLNDSASELLSIYGVDYPYVYTSTAPTANQLYNNINSNYPVFGRWMFYVGVAMYYHQAVIRGYQDSTGRVYVMDPDDGDYYSGLASNGIFY